MRVNLTITLVVALCGACGAASDRAESGTPWTTARARDWYAQQTWLVGANFVPSTAGNQLEMWQATTFDEATIDRELGWAQDAGLNTVRVFLHDLLWQQDSAGFLSRIDRFLTIADSHGIRVMLVLFDGVWDPFPALGAQPEPTPYVHNSTWVQSPGADVLADASRVDDLRDYVVGVVGRFADDPRVVIWDIFNEPDNMNFISYRDVELLPDTKSKAALALMRRAYGWARSVQPTQPLTSAVFFGGWGAPRALSPINNFMLYQSDIVSFHAYFGRSTTEALVDELEQYERPIICTEYMARSENSTFADILPIYRDRGVAAYHWGWVDGRSQTKYPWSSWTTAVPGEPTPWFHDVLHPDGSPYDGAELQLLRDITGQQ